MTQASKAEEFICALYGMNDLHDVNEVRYVKLHRMTGKMNQVTVVLGVGAFSILGGGQHNHK